MNGRIQSIDRVKDEIQRVNDELKDWVNSDFHAFFVSTDQPDVVEAHRKIMDWVQRSSQFLEAAKAEFAKDADGWLVAYAMAKSCVVVTHEQFSPETKREAPDLLRAEQNVTHEQFSPETKRRVPIPNMCKAFGVPYVNTFQMLRDLGVRLR